MDYPNYISESNSPISQVIKYHHHDPNELKSLIDSGENVNELLRDNTTYLMILVKRYGNSFDEYYVMEMDEFDIEIRNITARSIMILLNAGINVMAKDIEGRTALNMAYDPNDDGMIPIIEALETRENEEIRTKKKMSFYTSLIKNEDEDEDLPRNKSAPLSGLFSGIGYNTYLARYIDDYAFGEDEEDEDEGAKESKSDSGGRRRKSIRKSGVKKRNSKCKSKRKSVSRKKSKRKSKRKRSKKRKSTKRKKSKVNRHY